jgi:Pyridoxal-dependent decarboxylase conserved domain
MCIRCQALLVNFDCCGLWVRDAEPLKAALSLTPEFLRARGNTLDYKVRWLQWTLHSASLHGLAAEDQHCR